MVFFAHDGDYESRPAGERVRSFSISRHVVVMLPNVTSPPILRYDIVYHVFTQFCVNFAGEFLVWTFHFAGEKLKKGGRGGREVAGGWEKKDNLSSSMGL